MGSKSLLVSGDLVFDLLIGQRLILIFPRNHNYVENAFERINIVYMRNKTIYVCFRLSTKSQVNIKFSLKLLYPVQNKHSDMWFQQYLTLQ